MREISSSITFEIEPGETIPVMIANSTRLNVEGASVWVSRSDDVEDYWVLPGSSLTLRRGERLWMSVDGDRPARVAFHGPLAARERVRGAFAALAERLGMHWRGGLRTV